jgi:hypothetical protein
MIPAAIGKDSAKSKSGGGLKSPSIPLYKRGKLRFPPFPKKVNRNFQTGQFTGPTGNFLLTALEGYGTRSSVNLILQFGGV